MLCQERVRFSSVLLLLSFYEAFFIPVKNKIVVKDKNQNFTSNKLNEKKFEHTFVKKLICEHLMPRLFLLKFLWKVGAPESKKCSSWSSCFLWRVLPGSANYFLMKNLIHQWSTLQFKRKTELAIWKKTTLLAFLGGSKEAISTTQIKKVLILPWISLCNLLNGKKNYVYFLNCFGWLSFSFRNNFIPPYASFLEIALHFCKLVFRQHYFPTLLIFCWGNILEH